MSDRIAVMNGGRVEQVDDRARRLRPSGDRLRRRLHRHLEPADAARRPPRRRRGRRWTWARGCRSAPPTPATVARRSRSRCARRRSRSAPSPGPGRTCVRGRIAQNVFLGSVTQLIIELQTGEQLIVHELNDDESAARLGPGREVTLGWDLAHSYAVGEPAPRRRPTGPGERTRPEEADRMTRPASPSLLIARLAALVLAACGGGGGSTEVASAPADPEEPATGTLRVFTYEDTVAPDLIKPFEEQNPDLEREDGELRQRLRGGGETGRRLPGRRGRGPASTRCSRCSAAAAAPIDTAGVPEWDNLAFTDAPGVQSEGKVWVVPLSRRPAGADRQHRKGHRHRPTPGRRCSTPRYAGEVAIEGDYELPAIAEAALAIGIEDPMAMDEAELAEATGYLKRTPRPVPLALAEPTPTWSTSSSRARWCISDGGPGIAAADDRRRRPGRMDRAEGGARSPGSAGSRSPPRRRTSTPPTG